MDRRVAPLRIKEAFDYHTLAGLVRPNGVRQDVERLSDAERRGKRIGEVLNYFAAANLPDREYSLRGVVRLVHRLADLDAIEYLANWSKPTMGWNVFLSRAVDKALQTPLVTPVGPVTNWIVDYTIAVMDGSGNIVGCKASGDGRSIKFAVSKIVCSMALDSPTSKRPGALFDLQNLAHLELLGLEPGKNLFIGAARPADIDGERIYVAAGGCHANLENSGYVGRLIGGAEPKKDTLAGALETMFAELVVEHLKDPLAQIKPHDEMRILSLLRVLN